MARTASWLTSTGTPTFLACLQNGPIDKHLKNDEFEARFLIKKSHRQLPLLAAYALGKFVVTNKIDVVHIHWKYDLHLAVFTRTLCARPFHIVVSRHMDLPHSKHDALHRFLYRRVDAYLCVTRLLVTQAHAHLPLEASKIHLWYQGVPPCPSFPEQPSDEKSDNDKFQIIMLGRITRQKGHTTLIQAISDLCARGHNVNALIVGHAMDANLERQLHTQVQALELTGHIQFKDFIDKPQALLASADCAVLCSRKETFGLVLVEAMRCHTCVVGTDAGGVPEIIEHERTGLLVPPFDSHQLARALEKLIKNPDLRNRLATQGAKYAAKHFDFATQHQKLLTIYANLD